MALDLNLLGRGKRKASGFPTNPAKKSRLEANSFAGFDDNVDEDDTYRSANDTEESDDDVSGNPRAGTDTPATPFSPARTKFPSELKTLKCTYEGCDKTYNRPARLEGHLRSHRNERPFACTYEGCDKNYIQEKHLKQHIKGSHLHEKEYACDWEGCEKRFLTAQRLRRHMAVHEGQGRFQCTEYAPCTETFRKHQTLQRHIRSAHLNLPEYACTHVDPRTSVACNAAFEAPGSLRNHMDREHNEPRYSCDECFADGDEHGHPQKLAFTTKAQLTQHIRESHVQCVFCNMKCSSQQALQQHLEARHSGASVEERKKVICEEPGCGKAFTKNSNLNAHIRSVHQGARFTCGQVDLHGTTAGSWDGQNACGAQFASKANLADHVRTQHLGLPSTINAGRIKGTGKTGASKKKAKTVTSTIDELTGRAYQELQGRDIPCAIKTCSYRFMRNYDHLVHLQSHHTLTPYQATTLTSGEEGVGKGEPESEPGNDEMMQQALLQFRSELAATPAADPYEEFYDHGGDVEWQLQRQAEEGGAFWVGADDAQGANDDQWLHEQREMQRLISQDDGNDHSFWDSIDPNLR